ncbi:hypothetical protein CO709_06825 [Burkholderia thailandensis]|nr:hypothetical protein CO709_06825 [Burkholderia thailandensis]
MATRATACARQIDAPDNAMQSGRHDMRVHASLMKTPDCADKPVHGTLCATVSHAPPSAAQRDPRQSFCDAACVPCQST